MCHLCYTLRICYLCGMKSIVRRNRVGVMSLVIAMLLVMMVGCRRYAGDEAAVGSALAMADSLRYDSPAAADSIVRSLDADSLGSSANAALYALLANEVNLYNDQVASADSLADIATDYYRLRSWLSDDAGRLYARALMQKAIQQSVDDENADAISTHKLASELIDTTNRADFNLVADVQFNLATLYAKAFSPKKEFLDIFKRANHYYMLAENKRRSANCLCMIGAYYRGVDMDSAYKYMNASLHLSRQIGDSAIVFRNLAHIERAYYMQGRYDECKQRCLYILRQGPNHVVKNEVLFDLSKAYARLGILDSAEYYKSQMTLDIDSPRDRYKMYSLNEVLSLSRGDNLAAYHYLDSASKLSAKVTSDSKLMQMHKIREKYDYTKIELKNRQLQNWVLVMLIIVIIMVGIIFYRRSRFKHDLLQQELLVAELQQSITMLQQKHSAGFMPKECNATTDADVSRTRFNEVYRRYLEVFGKIRELTTYISKDGQNMNIIKTMVSSLSEDKELSHNFIGEVRAYVNAHHNNILEHLRSLHPSLKEDDIDLLALMLAGYNTSMIVICMGYTDRASLNNKRSRLKKRLGIDVSISAYLQQLIESTQKQG